MRVSHVLGALAVGGIVTGCGTEPRSEFPTPTTALIVGEVHGTQSGPLAYATVRGTVTARPGDWPAPYGQLAGSTTADSSGRFRLQLVSELGLSASPGPREATLSVEAFTEAGTRLTYDTAAVMVEAGVGYVPTDSSRVRLVLPE